MSKNALIQFAAVPVVLSTALLAGAIPDSARTADCRVQGSREWLSTRPSPLDSATVVLGTATATICYSRPSARGRQVLDSLIPFGKVWRTGANEPTTLILSDSMEIAGVRLPAGRFILLTVPRPDRWIIVFNTAPETDPARMFANLEQAGQGSAVVEQLDAPLDRFTIRPDSTAAGKAFLMEWERFRIRVPVRR